MLLFQSILGCCSLNNETAPPVEVMILGCVGRKTCTTLKARTMFQAILISVLAATAVAFTNVQRAVRSSSVLKMGFETEIGAQPPLGFWVKKQE